MYPNQINESELEATNEPAPGGAAAANRQPAISVNKGSWAAMTSLCMGVFALILFTISIILGALAAHFSHEGTGMLAGFSAMGGIIATALLVIPSLLLGTYAFNQSIQTGNSRVRRASVFGLASGFISILIAVLMLIGPW